MIRSVIHSMFSFGLVWIQIQACADVPAFPVVGEYDGSAIGNVVDASAPFYEGNSSGSGVTASLVIGIDAFREEINEAFKTDRGGVVGFDNGMIVGGTQTDSFMATFGEGKSLLVTSVDHLRTDFIADNICVPISGPGEAPNGGFLAKSVVNGDRIKIRSSFDFTFTEQDFGAQEHVRAVGGTILGRNGAAESSKWLMKVRLDNGDIIAEIADLNFRSGNAKADTFFGARAPQGRYITGVAWINLDGSHSGLDGFAFITNGSPPKRSEPAENNGNNPGGFFGIPVGGNSGGSSGGEADGGDSYSLLFGRERR